MKTENGITVTAAGQPRPHADSIYEGTVEANSRDDAKTKLEEWRGCVINEKQSDGEWWELYFTRLAEEEPGLWSWRFVREYTG